MVRISRAEQVKRDNPIEDVLKSYGITLKKNGKSLVGLCPFHGDKNTPSLSVTPEKGLWHCFGCNAGGSVIEWVAKKENITNSEAIDRLFNKKNPSTINPIQLLNQVIEHYHKTFFEDKAGLKYLSDRGIEGQEIYNTFKIGYANGSLIKTLPESGEIKEILKTIGLLNQKGNEHFYKCVIFPIYDENKNVVGIYGRNIERKQHLYLPGPHKGVFNHQAAKAYKEIILTESIIDALSLYMLGYKNTIPLYGVNGLTEDHKNLFLKERIQTIYLCLDNDEAGKTASESLAETLISLGIEVKIVKLPSESKDINEYLIKGASNIPFKTLLESAEYKTLNQIEVKEEAKYPKISQDDDSIQINFKERQYRIRGLPSQRFDRMRVNIKISDNINYHIDTIDLYCARSRKSFTNHARKLLKTEPGQIDCELNTVINELEIIQNTSIDDNPVKKETARMTELEKSEALEYLKDENLLNKITKDMDALGYVGEESNKALGYLVSVSRKLDEPLSAIIMSQSSAGKSGLTEAIEKLTPPEECVMYSRITPQSLYYMDRSALKRKLLIIEERNGSESADYSVRTLQSRKKLTQAVPVKDPNTGKIRTQTFEVEGPVSYLETTTRASLNHENSTRCFELYLDESAEQTKRIHYYQKQSKTIDNITQKDDRDKICKLHHNIQRLLREIKVINPYAHKINFPGQWLRTRRDHLRFLNLIEAVTFLYQYQRQIKNTEAGVEYIESNFDDYKTAYSLAKDVLGESLAELKKPQREMLVIIEKGLEKNKKQSLTRREIREISGLPDYRVRSLLSELVSLEYLNIAEGSNGQRYKYKLADKTAGTKIFEGLTKPEELDDKVTKNSSK